MAHTPQQEAFDTDSHAGSEIDDLPATLEISTDTSSVSGPKGDPAWRLPGGVAHSIYRIRITTRDWVSPSSKPGNPFRLTCHGPACGCYGAGPQHTLAAAQPLTTVHFLGTLQPH